MTYDFLKEATHGRFRFPWCFARIDVRGLYASSEKLQVKESFYCAGYAARLHELELFRMDDSMKKRKDRI